MSTLEVDKLTPQSGTSLTLGDSGDTFTIPSGVTITNNGTQTGFGSNTDPFRNIIINGDMSLDQRNSGASQTIASANTYYIDRFLAREVTDGALTIDQDTTSPDDFTHSMKITTTTADSSLSADQRAYVVQKIEGYNISKLAFGTSSAKSITISFYVRSSLTGTFSGSILNEGENRSYVFEYTISSANTWERKTITIAGDTSGTWDTDNTVGMSIYFSMGMGSTYSGSAGAWSSNQLFASTGSTNLIGTLNATWFMTGLQIEEGTSATDFVFLPYDVNLQRCMRYYEILQATDAYDTILATWNRNTSDMGACLNYKVTKRTEPSFSFSNGNTFRMNTATGDHTASSISSSNPTIYTAQININASGTPLTAGQAAYINMESGNGDAIIRMDAEL